MRAAVEIRADRVVRRPSHDDGLLPHEGREEVSACGKLALMAKEQPRSGEYRVEFALVDFARPEYLSGDTRAVIAYEAVEIKEKWHIRRSR